MTEVSAIENGFPNVSRETWERLEIMVALLRKWQPVINLVSKASLAEVWTRHFADSLQLLEHVPSSAKSLVDLGSGAGFPGLVLAAALVERGTEVHLLEGDSRKCGFLREAARAMKVSVHVHNGRIEQLLTSGTIKGDVVTARALASTADLLALAHPLLEKGAVGLFLKGQSVETELTDAAKSWNINHSLVPSISDPRSRVLVIHSAEPLQAEPGRR
jgi:16S rRNA (guanine527-N7)-methyltransferase